MKNAQKLLPKAAVLLSIVLGFGTVSAQKLPQPVVTGTFSGHTAEPPTSEWSSDGKFLAFNQDNYAMIYDITKKKIIYTVKNSHSVFSEWNSNSNIIAFKQNNQILIYNATRNKIIHTIKSSCNNPLIWSPNGKFLACMDNDGIRTLEVSKNKEISFFPSSINNTSDLSWSKDSKSLIFKTSKREQSEKTKYTWNVFNVTNKKKFVLFESDKYDGYLNPTQDKLVFSEDNTDYTTNNNIKIWDIKSKNMKTLHLNFGYYVLIWSPDGKKFAAITPWDGNTYLRRVKIFDIATKKSIDIKSEISVNSEFAWSSDSKSFMYTAEGPLDKYSYSLSFLNTTTGKTSHFKTSNIILQASWSNDGKHALVFKKSENTDLNGHEGGLVILDVKANKIVNKIYGTSSSVDYYRISKDRKLMLSYTRDSIVVWDYKSRKKIVELYPSINLDHFSIEFSNDGKRIAFSSYNDIYIIDSHTGKYLNHFYASDDVTSMAWSKNDKLLAYGAMDEHIGVISIKVNKEIIRRKFLNTMPTSTLEEYSTFPVRSLSFLSNSSDLIISLRESSFIFNIISDKISKQLNESIIEKDSLLSLKFQNLSSVSSGEFEKDQYLPYVEHEINKVQLISDYSNYTTKEFDLSKLSKYCDYFAISPDLSVAASFICKPSGNTLNMLNLKTGAILATIKQAKLGALAFSPDGKELIVGSGIPELGNTITVYGFKDPKYSFNLSTNPKK